MGSGGNGPGTRCGTRPPPSSSRPPGPSWRTYGFAAGRAPEREGPVLPRRERFRPDHAQGYTWSRAGQRAGVLREDKKGRRVNVLGALAAGRHGDLVWERYLRQDRRGHAAGVRARGAGPAARWCCRTGQAPAGFTRVRRAPSSWTTLPRTWPGSSKDAARNWPHRRRTLLPPAPQPRAERRRAGVALGEVRGLPARVHTTADAVGTVDQALKRQRARIKGSAANFTKAAWPADRGSGCRTHRSGDPRSPSY